MTNKRSLSYNKLLTNIDPVLIPYRIKDKWGYCTPDKMIVIDCKYDDAYPFSEGLALVQKKHGRVGGGDWGCINKNGEVVIAFKEVYPFRFSDGLACVNFHHEYIDATGKVIISLKHDDYGCDFSEGLAAVGTNYPRNFPPGVKQYGYINKTGEVAIPFKYACALNFSEGLAKVSGPFSLYSGYLNSWGCINKLGEEVIPIRYKEIHNFSEGLAAVNNSVSGWGFVNKSGDEVIPCKYHNVWDFSEGLAAVSLNKKWGWINKAGEEVSPIKYDFIWDFTKGLVAIESNYKKEYIDNEIILSFKNKSLKFSEGLACVEYPDCDNPRGFINNAGEIVIPFKYSSIGLEPSFQNGLARVKSYWCGWHYDGYIGKNGREYWEL